MLELVHVESDDVYAEVLSKPKYLDDVVSSISNQIIIDGVYNRFFKEKGSDLSRVSFPRLPSKDLVEDNFPYIFANHSFNNIKTVLDFAYVFEESTYRRALFSALVKQAPNDNFSSKLCGFFDDVKLSKNFLEDVVFITHKLYSYFHDSFSSDKKSKFENPLVNFTKDEIDFFIKTIFESAEFHYEYSLRIIASDLNQADIDKLYVNAFSSVNNFSISSKINSTNLVPSFEFFSEELSSILKKASLYYAADFLYAHKNWMSNVDIMRVHQKAYDTSVDYFLEVLKKTNCMLDVSPMDLVRDKEEKKEYYFAVELRKHFDLYCKAPKNIQNIYLTEINNLYRLSSLHEFFKVPVESFNPQVTYIKALSDNIDIEFQSKHIKLISGEPMSTEIQKKYILGQLNEGCLPSTISTKIFDKEIIGAAVSDFLVLQKT